MQCNAPGTPGAAWTIEEMVIEKAKLWNLFRFGDAPMKALGLGFHDCLQHVDGIGGCDVCLAWHNVGTNRPKEKWAIWH